MKKLFQVLIVSAIATLGLVAESKAQYTTLISGGTNNIAATLSTTPNADVVTLKGSSMSLLLSFKLTGAGTDVVTFTFKPTDAAGNVSTVAAQALTFPVTANGTTTVNYLTNVTVGAMAGYRLTLVTNAAAAVAVTNLTAKAIVKPGI